MSLYTLGLLPVTASYAEQSSPPEKTADNNGLEVIEITSQRRVENVQKAALAVSAISTKQLERSGITQPDQLSFLVPALQINKTGGTGNSFYVRGVGSQGLTAFSENAVAFNLDSVYIGRPASVVGTFFDLERLELLKGPQGILYGRNATGGAINVITRKPEIGFTEGSITLGVGNYSSKHLAGFVNLDVSDNSALRIAGQYVSHDGYLSDGYDDEEGKALRVGYYIEVGERFNILFSGDYYHAGGTGPGSVLVSESAPPLSARIGGTDSESIAALEATEPTTFFLSRPGFVSTLADFENFNFYDSDMGEYYNGYQDSDFWGISATVDGQFDAGTLTIIPAYRSTQPDTVFSLPGFPVINKEDTEQLSLEVRFTSTQSTDWEYVVGAYAFQEDQKAMSWSEPFSFGAAAWGPAGEYFYADLSTDSAAIFGQLTVHLSDVLRLTAGGRYTSEEKGMITRQSPLTLESYDTYDFHNLPEQIQAQDTRKFTNLSYKSGLEYDLSPDSLLYTNVSTGFKSGGFFADTLNNAFEAEEITTYVIGSKNRFLDNTLQVNFEGFYWDYTDQQISYLGYLPSGSFGLITRNAGEATIQGAELDIQLQVFGGGLIKTNIQYLDATYDSFVYDGAGSETTNTTCETTTASDQQSLSVDCSGKPAINSPVWTVNFGYEQSFDIPGDMYVTGSIWHHFETERYIDIGYLPTQQQDSVGVTDVSLTINSNNAWRVTLYANNITDEVVITSGSQRPVTSAVYSALKAPRTFGIRATIDF